MDAELPVGDLAVILYISVVDLINLLLLSRGQSRWASEWCTEFPIICLDKDLLVCSTAFNAKRSVFK
jgi:hypothetical protein